MTDDGGGDGVMMVCAVMMAFATTAVAAAVMSLHEALRGAPSDNRSPNLPYPTLPLPS